MSRRDYLSEILASYDNRQAKSAEWPAQEREYVAEMFPGFKEDDITRFCAIESKQLKEKLCFMKRCAYAGKEGPIPKDWYDDAIAAMLGKGISPNQLENFADEELDGLK